MSLAVKVLKPNQLIAYFLISVLLATVAGTSFSIFYGLYDGTWRILSGWGEGFIIKQSSARTIYSSRVPLALAISLSMLPNVEAKGVILTPVMANGQPITVRAEHLTSASKSEHQTTGYEALIGIRASKRLNIQEGDLLIIGSFSKEEVYAVPVAGVYETGDKRDFEVLVPWDLGTAIANVPNGLASIIEVKGIEESDLLRLVEEEYTLTIDYQGADGRIVIFDALNASVLASQVKGDGTIDFKLPFGKYRVVYEKGYLTLNVGELLLRNDTRISVKPKSLKPSYSLLVEANEELNPTLKLENGSLLEGSYENGRWSFEAPPGLHTLCLGEDSYLIPLFRDAVFSYSEGIERYHVSISLSWADGREAKDYLIVVIDASERIVWSSRILEGDASIFLEKGDYRLEVFKPPYFISKKISVSGDRKISLKLPTFSNLKRASIRFYKKLEAKHPSDISNMALTSLTGMTFEMFSALIATLVALSAFAMFSLQQLQIAATADNLLVLVQLGGDFKIILKLIGSLTLAISLSSSLIASYLAVMLSNFITSSSIVLFGYELTVKHGPVAVFLSLLGFISWIEFQYLLLGVVRVGKLGQV